LNVQISHTENPKAEQEEHYYNPDHQNLLDLGYKPTKDVGSEMETMMKDLLRFKEGIEARADVLLPNIRWDGSRKRVGFIG